MPRRAATNAAAAKEAGAPTTASAFAHRETRGSAASRAAAASGGTRSATKRGHTSPAGGDDGENDASRGRHAAMRVTAPASVEGQSLATLSRSPPMMRFTDLMRSIHTPPKPPPSTSGSSEDGSAEALLSLMESVRARNMSIVPAASVTAAVATKSRKNIGGERKAKETWPDPPIENGDSSSGERGGDSGPGDASSDGGETPRTKPHKKRKSTHTVRKEEKATLLEEIKNLEKRLTFLRGQVFAPVRDKNGQIVQPGVSNALLRQAIHEQQLRFASARSLLSQSLTSELAAPLHTYLHLGADMAERRAVLLTHKAGTLASCKRYIEERSRSLDLTRHHAVVERFETVTGDTCCIRFYVDQFPSALTVKNVHDATSFFTSNLEMSITDSLGHIAIREDDDSGDTSLSQHRLVVAGSHGVVVDVNAVVYSHFNEQENYGILATTYVDEDDLHPYRPLERIRQDVTGVSLISLEGDVVVVRRWAYICMRHSEHVQLPYGVLQTVRENLGIWGDAMMQFVRERLRMQMQQAAS